MPSGTCTKSVAAGVSPAAMLAELPEAKPEVRKVKSSAKPALFEKKDVNHDNKLTRGEFFANQPDPAEAPKRFERFDVNKDGVLSRAEFIHSGAPPKP